MEKSRTVQVLNDHGLHARPCHSIVTAALDFESDLRIRCGGREVNGKSILELMTLGACHGVELELSARGRDAEDLLEAVARLFANRFGED